MPPSLTVSVVGLTVTPRVSSSVIVTVVPVTARPAAVVLPVTDSVSLLSSTASSVGSSEKVSVPLVCPAAIVTVTAPTVA